MDRTTSWALVGFSLLLLIFAVASLQWRTQHDVPIFVYLSWLIDRLGFVPYRDLFDYNLPGTYAAYSLIARVFGYGDFGMRIADLLLLAGLCTITWTILRPFGARCGWFAALAFSLWYVKRGPAMALQRDFFALLPVAGAVACALRVDRSPQVRAALVGLLLGCAATIKPYALVGLPWLVLWLAFDTPAPVAGRSRFGVLARVALAAAAGVSAPALLVAGYLYAIGAWAAYWDILINYWPLYGAINGQLQILPIEQRPGWLFAAFRNGVLWPNAGWVLLAILGGVLAWMSRSALTSAAQWRVVALLGLIPAYALYPLAGGKLWHYHTTPFVYVTMLACGLCLLAVPVPADADAADISRPRARPLSLARQSTSLLAIAVLAFYMRPPPYFFGQLRGEPLPPPKWGTPDKIAAFLAEHAQPEDRVQPLDWTAGAVHGLLLSRAVLATPYVYDEQFYHHVSTPYVQHLRADFLERLAAQPPRFVIDILNKPTVSGADTTQEFPELFAWLNRNYDVVASDPNYRIFERRQSMSSRTPRCGAREHRLAAQRPERVPAARLVQQEV